MLGLSNISEKLNSAIRILATTDADLKTRLIAAGSEFLHISDNDVANSGNLESRIETLRHDLLGNPKGHGDGWVAQTVNVMSPDRLKEVAEEIIALDYEVDNALRSQRNG